MTFYTKTDLKEEEKIRGIKYVPLFTIDFSDVIQNKVDLGEKMKEFAALGYKTPLYLKNFLSPTPEMNIFGNGDKELMLPYGFPVAIYQHMLIKLLFAVKQEEIRPKIFVIDHPNEFIFNRLGNSLEERLSFIKNCYKNEYVKICLPEQFQLMDEKEWEPGDTHFKMNIGRWNQWANKIYSKRLREIIEQPTTMILGRIFPWSLAGDGRTKRPIRWTAPNGDIEDFSHIANVSSPKFYLEPEGPKYKTYNDPLMAATMDMIDLIKLFSKPILPWITMPGTYNNGVINFTYETKKAWIMLIEAMSDRGINECMLDN